MRRLLLPTLLFAPFVALGAQGTQGTPPARGSLVIVVNQQGSGAPISDATVTVSPIGPDSANRIVKTDASGGARLGSIPSGPVFVNVGAPGFVSINLVKGIAAGGTDTLRIALNMTGTKGVRTNPGALTNEECEQALAAYGFGPNPRACEILMKSQARQGAKGGG